MGMNFINHPMASHFVFATFLKAVSDLHPGCLDTLMRLYSEDVESLLLDGITSSDHTKQVWFCHMNTKGDLPALQRLGSLQRNFLWAPKAKASKNQLLGFVIYAWLEKNTEHQMDLPTMSLPIPLRT